MHSVKSETKCITTIGTVNSRTAMFDAISGLGLESLWEIKVQFSEIPVTCVCFYWVRTRLFARWPSFSSFLYQNPLNPRLIHKAFYLFRSPSFDGLLTDWAKPRPDGGVLLCESSVQVAKLTCEENETSIVYLHGRAESEKYNEPNLERKLRITKVN